MKSIMVGNNLLDKPECIIQYSNTTCVHIDIMKAGVFREYFIAYKSQLKFTF